MYDAAKRYSNSKYALSIITVFYTIALLLVFLGTGLSSLLESTLAEAALPRPLLSASFLLLILFAYYLLNLPLHFYATFTLEHKFAVSQQTPGDWLKDELKSGLLAYAICLILVFVFYRLLDSLPRLWWLVVSCFWILFSVILAKLTPVFIIPLFFKYNKLKDEELCRRVFAIAAKMGVEILDVFEIDFSRKTLKANAAFAGLGRSRRVILADTLRGKYSHGEIEVILAHEFAHYRLRHIIKLIALNSLFTLALFYFIFRTNVYLLGFFGIHSLRSLAGLPLLFLYFIVFGLITQPLEAYFSRRFEREADRLALEKTGAKEAFISLMNKLARQNLADTSPHPAVKFFFFDHPPIAERIKMASSF